MGIDLLENPDEILKPGIHPLKVLRFHGMGLGPMRSSVILEHHLLERLEQFSIRRVEPIRPNWGARVDQLPRETENHRKGRAAGTKRGLLVLDNPDPGSNSVVAGAQPNIIRGGEADLDRKMDPSSVSLCVFPFKQVS